MAQKPKMIQWVINHSGGLVKDEKQAQYVLITFVIVATTISFFQLFGSDGSGEIKAPPGYHMVYPDNAPPHIEQDNVSS